MKQIGTTLIAQSVNVLSHMVSSVPFTTMNQNVIYIIRLIITLN